MPFVETTRLRSSSHSPSPPTILPTRRQIQILNLIADLQSEHRFAALFISHDIAAVRYVAHHIAVAYQGERVETGPVRRFYGGPEHSSTRRLLGMLPITYA